MAHFTSETNMLGAMGGFAGIKGETGLPNTVIWEWPDCGCIGTPGDPKVGDDDTHRCEGCVEHAQVEGNLSESRLRR